MASIGDFRYDHAEVEMRQIDQAWSDYQDSDKQFGAMMNLASAIGVYPALVFSSPPSSLEDLENKCRNEYKNFFSGLDVQNFCVGWALIDIIADNGITQFGTKWDSAVTRNTMLRLLPSLCPSIFVKGVDPWVALTLWNGSDSRGQNLDFGGTDIRVTFKAMKLDVKYEMDTVLKVLKMLMKVKVKALILITGKPKHRSSSLVRCHAVVSHTIHDGKIQCWDPTRKKHVELCVNNYVGLYVCDMNLEGKVATKWYTEVMSTLKVSAPVFDEHAELPRMSLDLREAALGRCVIDVLVENSIGKYGLSWDPTFVKTQMTVLLQTCFPDMWNTGKSPQHVMEIMHDHAGAGQTLMLDDGTEVCTTLKARVIDNYLRALKVVERLAQMRVTAIIVQKIDGVFQPSVVQLASDGVIHSLDTGEDVMIDVLESDFFALYAVDVVLKYRETGKTPGKELPVNPWYQKIWTEIELDSRVA